MTSKWPINAANPIRTIDDGEVNNTASITTVATTPERIVPHRVSLSTVENGTAAGLFNDMVPVPVSAVDISASR